MRPRPTIDAEALALSALTTTLCDERRARRFLDLSGIETDELRRRAADPVLLAAHGHEPQAVTDSRQALDAAREFAPDLVITDIQLPHVSGLDLIRLIRADEQLKAVPIMAVTAYASLGDEERIRGAGAESYVTKPISVARFVQEVDSLLARKEPVEV